MKLTKKIGTLASVALVAGSVLAPAQANAQTTQMCGGLPVTIMGTSGDDVIFGTGETDVIFGAQGDDRIFGFAGDDIICAGKGNDVVVGGDGFDILFGAQGNDVLFSGGGSTEPELDTSRGARMFGGDGDDLMVGSDRWDRMQGGPGVDHIDGHGGRDWIRGGAGNDYLDGGGSIDDIYGGNGNDHIRATTGDFVRGSNGNDLCDVHGVPEVLISCTDSPAAFRSARHMPIVAPDTAGLIQTTEYHQQLINNRDWARQQDHYVASCQFSQADFEAQYAFFDERVGPGWTTDIEFQFFGNGDSRETGEHRIDWDFLYSDSAGNLTGIVSESQVLALYENGAWRLDLCSE